MKINKTVQNQGFSLKQAVVVLLLGMGIGGLALYLCLTFCRQPTTADGDKISFQQLNTGLTTSKDQAELEDKASNDLLLEKSMMPQLLPDGTKEFDLSVSTFPWQLYPGMTVMAWGYNGQLPGPMIRLKVGDKVLFVIRNYLPQATTIHWHGLAVPNSEDGVPGVTQKAIAPGGEHRYRFVVTPQMIGTHLYHSHVNDDFQVDRGLHGVLIVDPAGSIKKTYDRDVVYEIASYKVGGSELENVFTLNGKAYPEAPALRVRLGDKILIRLVNSSAEETHVMHLHGYTFKIVALDGNPLEHPISANTVNLAPSQTADIMVAANNPGAWMFHCHVLDHLVNPGPYGDGSEKEIAEMGGLMTYLQVLSGKVDTSYLAACSLTKDPTCSKP
jgi:FtsP/CotA-like multicopper oxidase with cupredoxin domain